jgi:hypothetical protein
MTRMKLNASGRWEIYVGKMSKHEVTSGDVIFVEVEGENELQPTRIEFAHDERGGGRYVSIDDYPLWDGMRAEVRRK